MLRATAIAMLLVIPSHPANAFQVSCEDVRAYVAEHGRAKAVAFAIKNGATFKQLNDARRCFHAAPKPTS